jgi:hypothetical protein
MVTFLTSIRHPKNSDNFAKVEALFETTLRSVCAQTDPNFRVVVVAHEIPRIHFTDPRVTYHLVDYPRPDRTKSLHGFYRDKGTKLLAGMLAARPFQPDYFAFFDADDFVSNRIAQFVNTHSSEGGWYVDAGYAVNAGTWTTQRKRGLYRYCGTTLLPNAAAMYRFANIYDTTPTDLSQEAIVQLASPLVVDHVVGNHPYMVGYFASRGVQMRPLPFRAICWLLETGVNNSTRRDGDYGLPVTDAICREFGIPPQAPRQPSLLDRIREGFGAVRSAAGSLRARLNFPIPTDQTPYY